MTDYQHLKPTAISVDVEDGINIAMRDIFGKDMNPTDRVVTNTQKILDIFTNHEVKATFFILGQVAEHYPHLVKKIHEFGHEIGVHGYDHYRIDKMDRKMAWDQIYRAKSILEDLTGVEVMGHRAPAFSINSSTRWALGLLAEMGFKYDSSIMPCQSAHYGWKEFPEDITEIKIGNQSIYEVPMSTFTCGVRKLPFLGGSYFRLLPYGLTSYALKKVGRKRNPIFYMHPYEIDTKRYPDYYFDALESASLRIQVKMRSMWFNRKSVIEKIERLVKSYTTDSISSILNAAIHKQHIPVIRIGTKKSHQDRIQSKNK